MGGSRTAPTIKPLPFLRRGVPCGRLLCCREGTRPSPTIEPDFPVCAWERGNQLNHSPSLWGVGKPKASRWGDWPEKKRKVRELIQPTHSPVCAWEREKVGGSRTAPTIKPLPFLRRGVPCGRPLCCREGTRPSPTIEPDFPVCAWERGNQLNHFPLFMGSRQAKGEPVGGPTREKKKSQRINPAYAFPCLRVGARKGGRFTNRPYDKTPSISS